MRLSCPCRAVAASSRLRGRSARRPRRNRRRRAVRCRAAASPMKSTRSPAPSARRIARRASRAASAGEPLERREDGVGEDLGRVGGIVTLAAGGGRRQPVASIPAAPLRAAIRPCRCSESVRSRGSETHSSAAPSGRAPRADDPPDGRTAPPRVSAPRGHPDRSSGARRARARGLQPHTRRGRARPRPPLESVGDHVIAAGSWRAPDARCPGHRRPRRPKLHVRAGARRRGRSRRPRSGRARGRTSPASCPPRTIPARSAGPSTLGSRPRPRMPGRRSPGRPPRRAPSRAAPGGCRGKRLDAAQVRPFGRGRQRPIQKLAPARCAGVRPRAISSSARGCRAAASTIRSATAAARSVPNRAKSRLRAWAGSSPPRRSSSASGSPRRFRWRPRARSRRSGGAAQ